MATTMSKVMHHENKRSERIYRVCVRVESYFNCNKSMYESFYGLLKLSESQYAD